MNQTEPTITHLDDLFVIGQSISLSRSLSNNQILCSNFWKTFNAIVYRRHMKQQGEWIKYGLHIRSETDYQYMCAIPSINTYPDDFQLYKIPRNDYLIFQHIGPMSALADTIHYIWKTYLPAHGVQTKQDELVYMERYKEGFLYEQSTSCIELLIPIQQDQKKPFPLISAKSLLQGGGYIDTGYTTMSWFGMDFNMNLYKGCCHGCIYCDSRSKCYQVHDFDIVRGKEDEITILQQELKRKRRKGTIGIGAMSDTYNPYEKKQRITRLALQCIANAGFGVGIDTKSDLIVRDIDLLKLISVQYPSIVKMTITCADDALSKLIEPHVVPSSKRFEAIQELCDAGIFAGILLMPILPFINDTEANIRGIVERAHLHHAKFIYAHEGFGVTLRDNQRDYFYYMLDQYFPGKRKLYENYYHNSYNCISPHARKLKKVLQEECTKYGMLFRMKDIINAYKSNIPNQQMKLKL